MGGAPTILVRGPNWTGDLVMATPGFRSLRRAHPEAHIALHLRAGLEPLMRGAPWFDELIPVASYRRGLGALLREGLALRRRFRFDLGVCIPDSFSSALLMRAAGVRRVVGYRRGGRGFLLHRAVTPPAEWGRRRLAARERFVLGLMVELGCAEQGTRLELFTTEAEEKGAGELLAAQGIGAGETLVALAPGASYGASKLWPAASFAEVGDALARAGARVLLLGAPSEVAVTGRVASAMSQPAADLAGRVELGELKALLRRAALLVCNDAGARHIATAFEVPAVVMMGPTGLEKTNLNLERVRVIETQVECRPCYRRECPIDHRCMTRLDPHRVIETCLELLAERRRSGWSP
jgi:heptosyltransferase-2